jgi:hypothetical protein
MQESPQMAKSKRILARRACISIEKPNNTPHIPRRGCTKNAEMENTYTFMNNVKPLTRFLLGAGFVFLLI